MILGPAVWPCQIGCSGWLDVIVMSVEPSGGTMSKRTCDVVQGIEFKAGKFFCALINNIKR